jgi:hypothetical protein
MRGGLVDAQSTAIHVADVKFADVELGRHRFRARFVIAAATSPPVAMENFSIMAGHLMLQLQAQSL